MKMNEKKERKTITVRCDDVLYDALERYAKETDRSMSAAARYLLRRALEKEGEE